MKILRCCLLGLSLVLLLTACESHVKTMDSSGLGPTPLMKFTPTMKPKVAWKHVIDAGSGKYFLHLSPAVTSHHTLFIASYKGNITAINSLNGHRLWHHNYRYHFVSGIALGRGMLFVGTEDGHLLAIKQSTGCIVWSIETSSQMLAAPQVGGDLVFAHTTDGVLTAYVISNGELSWQQRETQPSLMLYLGSQPVVVGDKVLCGFANGRLIAFDLTDGHQLWARQVAEPEGITPVSRMVDITSRPVVIDGTVYVVNYQGNLMALNLASGNIFWQHKLSAFANIAATSDRLYLTDSEGEVWAFDRRSGAVLWRQTDLARRNLTGPAVTQSAVVVGDARGYVHWLSPHDGHFLARVHLSPSSLLTQPLVYGNHLYIYASSGKIVAYKNQ